MRCSRDSNYVRLFLCYCLFDVLGDMGIMNGAVPVRELSRMLGVACNIIQRRHPHHIVAHELATLEMLANGYNLALLEEANLRPMSPG